MNLTIGWLYPRLMNVYGDIGNIIVFKERAKRRGIKINVVYLDVGFNSSELDKCDFLFMGGAQDRQQTIVSSDLRNKAKKLRDKIKSGIPGLYVCGAFQFLGKYYKEADGTIIKGLGIFDLYTENPGENVSRLIGNVAADSDFDVLIGFENHGGRTYLGKDMHPLGTIIKGYGNNGKDKTEGGIYKNSYGTYFHGPILPKNPKFTDYLIKTSLEKKYGPPIKLSPIDSSIEEKARKTIAMRLGLM